MRVRGRSYRTIWTAPDRVACMVIDQTKLPHAFQTIRIESAGQAVEAIRTMVVRGAPLIGAAAAYGLWLALRADPGDRAFEEAATRLLATRPTAVNLRWALDRVHSVVALLPARDRAAAALSEAEAICDEDVETNHAIGRHGLAMLRELARSRGGEPLNILTHCNAGWLATVDWGTALAPIYLAHEQGIAVHVWVGETRPRSQGAKLTAWELLEQGVPHTVIVDSASGHLMQRGLVDACITGTDRTTRTGDVCNKIGTYLKALAARDNGVPFYVALPWSTIDWTIADGVREIPIEQRDASEVCRVSGRTEAGESTEVTITPAGSAARNDAFDVTPARLVTGLITERGICAASEQGLAGLYPEHFATRAVRR